MNQIVINQNETQTITIDSLNTQDLNVSQLDNQTLSINNELPQDINISQPDNQVILVEGGSSIYYITDVLVNGVSVVSNNVAYVIVPTKTSELENNSGFITNETDPTVPYYVKQITLANINSWNNKQDNLVSGSNIKTINNTSLLGSGNINIGSNNYIAGDGININDNIISNTILSYNDLEDTPTIPTKTSDLINDSDFVSSDELSDVAFSGSYADLSNTPDIPDSTSDLINDSDFIDETQLNTALSSKQDTLVSSTNIKTINNTSLLGSGNINISGGTSIDVQINGTSIINNDVANIITESVYNPTTNKLATNNDIPTNISDLNNDSGFIDKNVNDLTYYTLSSNLSSVATSGNYNDLSNTPTIINYDIQKLSGTLALNSFTSIAFPSGFNENNTHVIGIEVQVADGSWRSGEGLASAGDRLFTNINSGGIGTYNTSSALNGRPYNLIIIKI